MVAAMSSRLEIPEAVAAALVGHELQAITRNGESEVVLDFGRHGTLTVSASIIWAHEQQSAEDLDVLDRLDVGAVAELDLT
jgi:hypothetical protein